MTPRRIVLNIRGGVTRLCTGPTCRERAQAGEQLCECPMCSVLGDLQDQQRRDNAHDWAKTRGSKGGATTA